MQNLDDVETEWRVQFAKRRPVKPRGRNKAKTVAKEVGTGQLRQAM